MKKVLLFLFLAVIVLSGCKKTTENQPVVRMKDLSVPAGFSWNATKTVTLNLHNLPSGVIRITSEDHSSYYAKFSGREISADRTISLMLPASVNSVMINEFSVHLTGTTVDFSFPSLKSATTTNYSMSFNGTDAWVNVQGASSMTFTNQYSLSAWVRADRQQTAKLVQKGDWDGFGLGQDYWNGWQTTAYFSDGTNAHVTWGNGRPVLNQWYHLAGTYDGTTVKLYVNGTLVASQAVSKTLHNNGRIVSIASDAGAQKFFGGLMDEVTIWNVGMTAAQVNTAYTTGFTGNESGLKGYWKFNDGSGAVSFDASASHFNGTNINTSYNTEVGYILNVDTDQDGVPDTYDDYPADPLRAYNNFVPSSGGNSLAFEDLWPSQGDYDFNDLVVGYRINTITNAQGKIVESDGNFTVKAIGGSYRNGFGFSLPGCTIPLSDIHVTGSVLQEGYITTTATGLEADQVKPTIIVFDNAYKILPGQSGSTGVNVSPGAPYETPVTIILHISYPPNTYTLNQLAMTGFNPFLIINKIRGNEVHLADFIPTSRADTSVLGTFDDDSQPGTGRYYRTTTNLSWAICVPGDFQYPFEKQDILGAYKKMAVWAQSGGEQYPDWYENLPGYRDNSKIYSH